VYIFLKKKKLIHVRCQYLITVSWRNDWASEEINKTAMFLVDFIVWFKI